MENITVIRGTELKLILTISGLTDSNGILETNYDLKVSIFTSLKDKITMTDSTILRVEGREDQRLLIIDTSLLNTGTLNIEIEVDIPDDDFTGIGDSKRKEIYRKSTNINIIK